MPVTIARKNEAVAEAPVAADPTDIRMRDRRPDPMGPAARALLASKSPDKKMIRAAYDELIRPLNRMSYYTDYSSWWGVNQRLTGLLNAADKVDAKKAQGLVQQLWKEYARTMKHGVFERRWGHEPVSG